MRRAVGEQPIAYVDRRTPMTESFVEHPLMREKAVERRSYQERIAGQCFKVNTLVCLPTGLGKTVVAALVVAERLKLFPNGRVIIMAPTRPLTLQHYKTFIKLLAVDSDDMVAITGVTSPDQRVDLWNKRVVFSTPQVVMNDLITKRLQLRDVVLLVFDEAHRAVGDYDYAFIGPQYAREPNSLILGLTASPGSTREAIEEVCRNLHIRQVEARTISSPDVKPYVGGLEVIWKSIVLPQIFHDTRRGFQEFLREQVRAAQKLGTLTQIVPDRVRIRDILEARQSIRQLRTSTAVSKEELRAVSSGLYSCIHAIKAIELLETQGFSSLNKHIESLKTKMNTRPSSALRKMMDHEQVQRSLLLVNAAMKEGIDHPKIGELTKEIKEALEKGARRIMVFTNYRSTAARLLEIANSLPGISAVRLVGQITKGEDKGLSQKEQAAALEQFKQGIYNVLIATQIGEEGLDIAECDEVIFYDNVPSAIRFIQRRGRTGRKGPGKATILMAVGTRDEAYHWIARRKERTMMDALRKVEITSKTAREQPRLEEFKEEKEQPQKTDVTIIVDSREGSSPTVKELSKLNLSIKIESLMAADFILSDRVAVERKTVDDLASSVMDGRLFDQLATMRNSYQLSILLVEGDKNASARGISPESLAGAVASVLVDYQIPVVSTKNPEQTALLLYSIARREQIKERREPRVRAERKPASVEEMQEFIVAGLPHIDAVRSRDLLKRFETVENVFTASKEKLSEVEGIGQKISERIREILTTKYREEDEK
jgi:Fanconi anemia group M protein